MTKREYNKREYKYEWDVLLLKCVSCGERKGKDAYWRWPRYSFWLRTTCKDCDRRYREEHKERIAKWKEEYYEKNRDEILKRCKEYKIAHKEEIKERDKRYRDKNKELLKEKSRKFYATNRERVLAQHKKYRDANREKINEKWREYGRRNKERIAEYRKEFRSANKEFVADREKAYKDKRSLELWFNRRTFHEKTRRYAIKYDLKPTKCPICWNSDKIQMHHPSYDVYEDWSYVVFCCPTCHAWIHAWLVECPKPINLLTLK